MLAWHFSRVSGILAGPSADQIPRTMTGGLRSRLFRPPLTGGKGRKKPAVPKGAGSRRVCPPRPYGMPPGRNGGPAAGPRRCCPPACSTDAAWRARPLRTACTGRAAPRPAGCIGHAGGGLDALSNKAKPGRPPKIGLKPARPIIHARGQSPAQDVLRRTEARTRDAAGGRPGSTS